MSDGEIYLNESNAGAADEKPNLKNIYWPGDKIVNFVSEVVEDCLAAMLKELITPHVAKSHIFPDASHVNVDERPETNQSGSQA